MVLLLLLRKTGDPFTSRKIKTSPCKWRCSFVVLKGVWKGTMECLQNMLVPCDSVQDIWEAGEQHSLASLSTSGTYWIDAWINYFVIRSKTCKNSKSYNKTSLWLLNEFFLHKERMWHFYEWCCLLSCTYYMQKSLFLFFPPETHSITKNKKILLRKYHLFKFNRKIYDYSKKFLT